MTNEETNYDSLIGKSVGKYLIEKEIGRGGMATVYQAQDRGINRTVAMKVLPPHFIHAKGFLERFKREVAVISSLEHPHILPIYDFGSSPEGIPFIVMRFMGGGTLEQLSGVEDLRELEIPLGQVAHALDYAHRNGVIHRDLKPSNVMLDDEGNAYLSDFGTAWVENSQLTGSNIIGTPHYMSPEQIDGKMTTLSDIYSLGVLLFELLSGQHPYEDETVAKVLYLTMHEGLPPLENYREGVSPQLQAVISKATHKDPMSRYKSAEELVEAFIEVSSVPQRRKASGRQTLVESSQTTKPIRRTGTFKSSTVLYFHIQGFDEPLRILFGNHDTLILGRETDDAKIDLDPYQGFEAGVSRHHAALKLNPSEQSLEIMDLASSNGTYVNGKKLEHRKLHRLYGGDELRLSMLVITVEFRED